MPSTMKRINPAVVEFAIEVPAQEIDKHVNKAYSRLSREAKVRGFRRGKVPRAVLKRMFGPAMLSELLSEIVSKFFIEALEEHGVEPISEPEVDAGELTEGQPFSYTVKVETSPHLEEINFDGIEIRRLPVTVSRDTIDKELERLRSALATATELEEPRPAQEGDLVTLEMKRWVDDDWKDAGMPPQELVLAEGAVPSEILAAVPGMNVDEEKEIEFGDTPEGEDPVRFLCRLVSVRLRKLPDIDDEFAKDLGDFDTLAKLEEDIEKRARESLEKNEADRLRHDLFDALREKNEMVLPPTIVDKQTQMMKAQFAGMLGKAGDDADDESAAKIDEGTGEAARNMVHQHFLLREVARQHDLAVEEKDVEAELKQMSEQMGIPVPKLKAELADNQRMGEVMTNLLERKVFDFVAPKVKIVDAEQVVEDKGDAKE